MYNIHIFRSLFALITITSQFPPHSLFYVPSMAEQLAEVQVTSELILQEAYANRERPIERPKQTIQDLDELRSYQLTKRREYEQQLNKNRLNFGQWLRYAKWEGQQNHDFARARSIYERALDVNVSHIPFWTHYIQFELSHKNVNHARNLLDRGVITLPRVDKLWYLYVQTEETLGNYVLVRTVFERWLSWEPNSGAWDAYVAFERRYDEYENARAVFGRYVAKFPDGSTWLKWVDFEVYSVPSGAQQTPQTRRVFELAVDTILGAKKDDTSLASIVSKWAYWETLVNEFERARAIYQTILNSPKLGLLPELKAGIFNEYTKFEKNNGDKGTIDSSILLKRKLKYEQEVLENPRDHDTWWLLLNIMQHDTQETAVGLRKVFQDATSVPPEDKYKSVKWKRYVYLWIRYALWEEFEQKNVELSREVLSRALLVIPHKLFTSAKLWIHMADFELRNSDGGLVSARKTLGRALGLSPKPKSKLYLYYIGLEKKLGEPDRVRKIFEKWLELTLLDTSGRNALKVLLDYIAFENELRETQRCISLFRSGLVLAENETLSRKLAPVEYLWLEFINFYKEEMQYEAARGIYKELLAKADDVRVWVSYALFESSILTETQLAEFEESEEQDFEFGITNTHRKHTRAIFKQAETNFKAKNEDRVAILEAWKSYEQVNGTEESLKEVEDRFPTMVKRRKLVDGVEEEYVEFHFEQDEEKKPAVVPGLSKFLQNAKKWAQTNG